jgi:serine protease AprX
VGRESIRTGTFRIESRRDVTPHTVDNKLDIIYGTPSRSPTRSAAAIRVAVVLAVVIAFDRPALAQNTKLDRLVQQAAAQLLGSSPVIVRAASSTALPVVGSLIAQLGGTLGRPLPIIDAHAAVVPNAVLALLAGSPLVSRISLDRRVFGSLERTGSTIGINTLRERLGYDGAGIGVAIIDSGVTSWHDDLSSASGGQRVDRFVDLVNARTTPYDDNGHGTHVAGIIAGNGFDSGHARSGVAPGATLVAVKVLDHQGRGRISTVIAALDYVLRQRDALNIRVANLSVSAGVYESYHLDPLTLAAKRLVNAGVVVVAAAGNAGRDASGRTQYGSITSPGNAPWVLSVGASSHMGTTSRADDTMARFSSRGPTAFDYAAKPDLVAPGVGIESLSDPSSAFYTAKAPYLLSGTVATSYLPYLSLSGTSMAAPVVAGTAALMLEANPGLTPNAVKAILQYTSQADADYNRLTQGVGFLNALGAVELARSLADGSGYTPSSTDAWSRQLIWGNRLVRGGSLSAAANAWPADVTWGTTLAHGQDVEWGVLDGTTTPWGVLTPGTSRNVVWGTTCGGGDCAATWTIARGGSAVTTNSEDTVVWGSSNDTVVWGSNGSDTVVWGSNGDDTVVWGSSCTDCEPVIWTP